MPVEDRVRQTHVNELARQDVEPEAEFEEQLVLPLLDESTGRHDQAPLDVVAQKQLLDVKPGHDRLSSAGVVRQEETKWRAREQLAVHRPDLVGERLYVARG